MIDIEKTVDLGAMTQMDRLPGFAFRGENNGHTFLIHARKNGQAVTLTGAVTAKCMRADGAVISIVGAITNGAAQVRLPGNAYTVHGQFILAIYVTNGNEVTAIYAASGAVIGMGEEGDEIPASDIDISFNEILERIAAAEADALADIASAKSGAQSAIASDRTAAQNAIAADKTAAQSAIAADKTAAQSAATSAAASKTAAETAASNAAASKTAAETAASNAAASKEAAEAAAEEAAAWMDGAGKDIKRYGASGWSLDTQPLTRLYDAVGMVAEHPGPNARNDFDFVRIWRRRKCVGSWVAGEGKAVFQVRAYEGDPDYREDGTRGDYVAVECLPAYVWDDGDTRVVSDFKLPGYRPFAVLESSPGSGVCREKTYLPAYCLALDDDGNAVSLPGFAQRQGSYAQLLADVKKYANADVKTYAMLEPAALEYYEETLFGIEYATKESQSISMGLVNARRNSNDRVTFVGSENGIDTFTCSTTVGNAMSLYVWVGATGKADYDASAYPTHKKVSVEVEGSVATVQLERVDSDASYTEGTEYEILGRAAYTGEGVEGDQTGLVPMKYRGRENIWGSQFRTCHDMFAMRVDDSEGVYHLDWYYMPDPTVWQSGNPSASTLENTAICEKLGVSTPASLYRSGYQTGRVHDSKYRDIWIPEVETGGSQSKYFGDYASLVISNVARAVRRGGYESSGRYAGVAYVSAYYAPSAGYSISGGGLFFVQ